MHFHPKNVQKFAVFHFAPPSTKSFFGKQRKNIPSAGKNISLGREKIT